MDSNFPTAPRVSFFTPLAAPANIDKSPHLAEGYEVKQWPSPCFLQQPSYCPA